MKLHGECGAGSLHGSNGLGGSLNEVLYGGKILVVLALFVIIFLSRNVETSSDESDEELRATGEEEDMRMERSRAVLRIVFELGESVADIYSYERESRIT